MENFQTLAAPLQPDGTEGDALLPPALQRPSRGTGVYTAAGMGQEPLPVSPRLPPAYPVR